MDTKKDIGQFFNDSFNQMGFTPNDNGWDKIENELNEKKRKKRILFWMFFGSFLSGCLLTLLLVYSNNLLTSNSVNNKNDFETVGNSNANTNSNENSNSNSNTNSLTKENHSSKEKSESNFSKDNNSITRETDTKYLKNNKNNVVSTDTNFKENNGLNHSKQNKKNRQNITNSTSQIHSKNAERSDSKYSFNPKISNSKRKNKSHSNQKSTALAFHKKLNQKRNKSAKVNFNSSDLKNTSATNFDKNLASEISIAKDSNAIAITEIEVKDTTNIAAIVKKPIKKTEKLLEKDSTEVVAEKKTNTFILSPYIGYGLLNKNQVKGNFNSSNDLNVSNLHYGINLRWMVNKKYGLQIGFGYINASTKTEIEKTNSNYLSFTNVANNSNVTFPPSNKLTMTHDLSMYEIPLEFYYKLNDRKISFAMATGINHTLIKDNTIYIQSPNEKTKIGELESILKQNFSANLKIYSTYKFSDKLQFELYPSLQYQFLNTLKNKDLNPLILSIRAGLSYQF